MPNVVKEETDRIILQFQRLQREQLRKSRKDEMTAFWRAQRQHQGVKKEGAERSTRAESEPTIHCGDEGSTNYNGERMDNGQHGRRCQEFAAEHFEEMPQTPRVVDESFQNPQENEATLQERIRHEREEIRREELRLARLKIRQDKEEFQRLEALRQEEMRKEALRQEEMRQEALRQEEMRQEALRQEEMRQEALRQEEMRQEALRQEELRQEEIRRLESLRQEEALRRERMKWERMRQEREESRRQQQQRERMRAQEEQAARNFGNKQRPKTQEAMINQIILEYDSKWSMLRGKCGLPSKPLAFAEVPWPILVSNVYQQHLTKENIIKFYRAKARRTGSTQDKMIRSEYLRWHPDKFDTTIFPLVHERDQDACKAGAAIVVRVLTDLKESDLKDSDDRP